MHMVILAVEPDPRSFKAQTGSREDDAQVIPDFFGDYLTPVFSDEDPMGVHQKYTVSTAANVWIISHWLNMIYACSAAKPINSN
jgi:hypothetical protein